ncbi:MAG: carbon monoxide dehydrogenase [Rhodobiaceae bacterium]|jgi:carbon-monoxide dehydrogenase small subunit|nr:carbon monoxide dehydrogenase [Hyphomicrobiales bacterium]MBS70504.1 carbon monoxide dehydrogenase [Rhodobiaceae bacterium]MEC7088693.1 (2Fe-2S)-binding protein [Pseudomonadota bacterium]MEC7090500.1 (2Fe-2S)-binding protein [Pseudomonadota bacterium]MEC7270229.1 (2Fe-2S)-binding protein [Pseudomonadota bacterium]|tara:strand:- start:10729 stop:11187 length:459 start_codon:yes stop_codon:yes gene_type:complete
MVKINININNKAYSEEVGDNTLLVELLRDKLGLTGTHVGCDTSQCGACVIHVDGDSVKSCTVLAAQVHGKDLTTVEGLASEGQLHPIQKSFQNNHALQCGFCTPGLVMSAVDLLKKNSSPSEDEIREWFEGHICRCTGYKNIIKAVQEAITQ